LGFLPPTSGAKFFLLVFVLYRQGSLLFWVVDRILAFFLAQSLTSTLVRSSLLPDSAIRSRLSIRQHIFYIGRRNYLIFDTFRTPGRAEDHNQEGTSLWSRSRDSHC